MKMIDIVSELEAARRAQGLTNQKLAHITGYSLNVIRRFLVGEPPHETVKTQTVIDIAAALGYRIEISLTKETPENA